ncbi:MAG: hypothetical protein FWE92_03740 [Defluviitaleaceae bacterium]|nr:hypothetical protein [Defluviitaleaceae bacterium]
MFKGLILALILITMSVFAAMAAHFDTTADYGEPIVHYKWRGEELLEFPNRVEYRRSRLLYSVYFSIEPSGDMQFQYTDRLRGTFFPGATNVGRTLDADNLLEDARDVSNMIIIDHEALGAMGFMFRPVWWSLAGSLIGAIILFVIRRRIAKKKQKEIEERL